MCDHVIEARRMDIVAVNKLLGDKRIGEKENEKVKKYQDFNGYIARM